MVALLFPSSTNRRRRRKADPVVRSLPATLLTSRIADLHRRLIDPAADVETVKAAKQSLLRLLSDPMTLPVITTPPMQMPVVLDPEVERKAAAAKRVCEIFERSLPTRSSADAEGLRRRAVKSSTGRVGAESFRSRQHNAPPRHPLSFRGIAGTPLSAAHSLS